MEIKDSCLVIADISGYTRFVMLHTTSLLHAETIITDLLEAVIAKAEHPLTIAKLEGDAVFLYAAINGDQKAAAHDILNQITGFFDAFRAKERALIACNICRCPACRDIGKLHLKVILHHGEVAIKEIRQSVELAGESVIVIHRLLKNSISAKEYIMMTNTFHDLSGDIPWGLAESRTEHAEGIGDVGVKVFYPSQKPNIPPGPPGVLPKPGTESAILYERMSGYAYRCLNGLESRRKFSSLPATKLNWLNRLDYGIGRLIPKLITMYRFFIEKR